MRISDWSSDVCSSDLRLGWSMSNNAPLPANAISARILCGEPKGAEAVPFSSPLTEGKRYANVRIPSSDCRWHWLSIDVALPDDAMGVDIVLSRSEERRVGKECVSPCSSRWSPFH